MSDGLKLAASVAVALIGAQLVIQRASIPLIFVGAVLVAVGGPLAYFYFYRWRHPNKYQIDVDILSKAGDNNETKERKD